MSDEFPLPASGDGRPCRVRRERRVDGRRFAPGRLRPRSPGTIRRSGRRPVGRLRLRRVPGEGRQGGRPGLRAGPGRLRPGLRGAARLDRAAHGRSGANPWDPAQLLGYLKDNPWEAASVTWTLNADQTPLYAIAPAGPFAGRAYELLREFLDEQLRGEIELVSIPGRLAGQARLFNGQVVPVVVPELRGDV